MVAQTKRATIYKTDFQLAGDLFSKPFKVESFCFIGVLLVNISAPTLWV